jgi:hypothetical protein
MNALPQSQDFSNVRDLPKLGPANLGEQERTLMKKNLSTTTTLTPDLMIQHRISLGLKITISSYDNGII